MLYRLCLMMTVLFCFVTLTYADETVIKGTTVLQAPWGKEPGQFGFFDPQVSLPPGVEAGSPVKTPKVFCLDKDRIYVHDRVNGRVQIFSREGKFLYTFPAKNLGEIEDLVVEEGNLYLLFSTGVQGREVILSKYSLSGRKLEERNFTLPKDRWGQIIGSHSLVVLGSDIYLNFFSASRTKNRAASRFSFKHMLLASELSPEDGYFTKTGVLEKRPLGIDAQGAIYFEEGNEKDRVKVTKKQGGKVSTLYLALDEGETGLPGSGAARISPQGEILAMYSTEDGLYICQWSLKGGEGQ